MHRSTLRTRSDMRSMVEDAQELFREAAATTGEKAEDLRQKGLELLDAAVSKAQDVQAAAIEAGKDIAATADDYVQENPWRAIAISAGVGLLLGLAISRK
ncbi:MULTISPECIES: DUF883 family protein [Collimonas]|jgi:ElaB/YqjD/DUF883 family membrane-anchored ribosome-binding protein|nr:MULTISPECIES: DUF883 family protein [Collimonas]NKI71238.1 DUF883 family protein [Collimonas pratensis]HWW05472.1 DUF883 family protein [Collimonas sp.]